MAVTSYYPEIFAKDIDKAVESYVKDPGFPVKHRQVNGDRVALISFPDETVPDGIYAMRTNVHDINECIEYFLVRGYRNPGSTLRCGRHGIHGKARYEMMISPEGVRVDIVEHQKDE